MVDSNSDDELGRSQRRAVELAQQGRLVEAIGLLDAVLSRFRESAPYAHAIRGELRLEVGQIRAAVADLTRAAALVPTDVELVLRLSHALCLGGWASSALPRLEEALRQWPQHRELRLELAFVLTAVGLKVEAMQTYDSLLNEFGVSEPASTNRAILLHEMQRFRAALSGYESVLTLDPTNDRAQMGRAVVLKDLGRIDDAMMAYREMGALRARPVVCSNEILTHAYALGHAAQRFEQARQFGNVVAAAVEKPYSRWQCAAEPERLRVGLVSADLGSHPVGYFLEGVLTQLASSRLEFVAFGPVRNADPMSQRLQQFFAAWHVLPAESDKDAAALIHRVAPHILIDLSGHTGGNRLPMFAYRPAPIQMSWLGYFGSTGLEEIDYVLADPYCVPAGAEGEFVEKVWRLPETRLCFTPVADAPAVQSPPCLESGSLTFGHFGNHSKLNSAVVDLWARVLVDLPQSRLLFKGAMYEDDETQDTLCRQFLRRGVEPKRLLFRGFDSRADYLAAYSEIDIVLDTFPFPGGTTTAEALWMGVPVLTLRGDDMLSRQGEALLINAGLPSFVTQDAEEFVAKARAIATDPADLAELRRSMRERVLKSPLFDAERFARHFADALWTIWQQHGAERLQRP